MSSQICLWACNSEYYGAKHKDKKIKRSDYDFLINPGAENPVDFLTYTLTGKIVELSNDEESTLYKKAKATIELFNLNDISLHNQRRTVSKQVQAVHDQLPLEEIKNEIGRFDSFIEFVFETCRAIKEQES